MLCKRTMRAALAPLVGLIGLLGATMVNAQNTLDAVVASQNPDVMDDAGAPTIASETLSAGEMNALVTEGHYHVMTSSSTPTGTTRDNTAKPDTWLELRTEVDILLSDRGESEYYYVRYDFDSMVFSKASLPKPEVRLPFFPTCDVVASQGSCGDGTNATATTTAYRYMVPADGIEVAYRGRLGDSEVIFRLPRPSQGSETYTHPERSTETQSNNPDGDYAVGTTITLLLPNHLAVMAAGEATYGATVKVFEDLSEARESAPETHGAEVYRATGDVISLARAVGTASVAAMLATAEVSTPETMGGAFRRFVDGADAGTDPDQTANLAMVSVGLANPMDPPAQANNNLMPVDSSLITGVNVTATSDAGNFGFGASFFIDGCGGTALDLRKPGDMGLAALEMGDSNDIATGAVGMAGGGTAGSTAAVESAFCIMAADHSDAEPAPPIPEVGDPAMMDGYMLAATPTVAGTVITPPDGTAMAAGAIDRNGTVVHIPYLSGSDNANQRLVIVNRGRDAARFWMSDFQTEGMQMVDHAGGMMLAPASMSEIPGGARMVVRIQDNLSFSERPPRTAGTLTVAAPTRNIDVMTVQVVGGTLDTTVYQHAEF